jgi:Protein of unknown function (DUF3667)
MKCKNCDNDFVGSYCNMCGQKVMARLTIKSVWNLIVDDVFEVDKGLLHTIKQLWLNPGKTSLDFVNGRTKNYYSPLKYLLFWTTIFFILSSLLDNTQEEQSIRKIIFNTTKPFTVESIREFTVIISKIMSHHTDIYFFGLTPFLVIMSYFIYRKNKFYFTELSILYLYILGQMIFFIAITIPFASLFEGTAILLSIVPIIAIIMYLVIKSHKQFFSETWIKSSIKGLVIFYGGQLIYMLAMLITLDVIKMFRAG